MKVVFLSTCYPSMSLPYSGIFIHQQALALKKLGVDVHIIQPSNWYPPMGLHKLRADWTSNYSIHKAYLKEIDGIQIHHPRVFQMLPSRFFYKESWEAIGERVGKYIKNQSELKDADWIYAHFICYEGYAGSFASEISGIKLVAIARGDDVHAWPEANPILKSYIQRVFDRASLILANSKNLAKDTLQFARSDQQIDVHTIYNGIDLNKFNPRTVDKEGNRVLFNLPRDKKLLLCIATPVVLKGWIELLDAIQQIKDYFHDWQLVMVAPPKSSPDCLDLPYEAERRNISNYVKYLGAVPHNDIPKLMNACEAFILPSYNEGLSNSVLEAMASGLAVITTDVGGHNEFIKSGENGLLIKPKSVLAIKQSLKIIVKNPDFTQKLRLNAVYGATQIGTYSSNAKQLFELLVGMNEKDI